MIDFVVDEDGDSVGTIVVEGVKAGAKLTGWVMEANRKPAASSSETPKPCVTANAEHAGADVIG